MGKGREEGREGKGKIEYITRKEENRTQGNEKKRGEKIRKKRIVKNKQRF